MAAFNVERSIVIDAPSEKVFDTVVDYGTWTGWSPWLCIDNSAEVTVTDDPRSVSSIYHWAGEVVGEGEMEHVELDRPHSIKDELRFIKPYRSTSKVRFVIESAPGGTEISWQMFGSLPWFLIWMRSSMETFIGMDFERGLKMLREKIETGEVLSQTEVMGIEAIESRDIFGVRKSCSIDEISPEMKKAVETTTSKFSENGIAADGEMVSAYHPVDLKKRRFDFTSGFCVDSGGGPPSGLAHCHIPAGKALHIRHVGSYENLGNSWSGAYQYARYKKIKIAKKDAFEVYRNDPSDTPPAELITDIYLPVK